MSDDYLWDRSGPPDLDTKELEELLAPLAHDAPLDELRVARGRQGELVRAAAQEPLEAPPVGGRAKGKMNLFDKRIIGAATLTAAAIGLLGVTVYKRRSDAPAPPRAPIRDPAVEVDPSFATRPPLSPVAPTTGADLAIMAGESAWIHVPFGAVDIEIQSTCNAEVEVAVVTSARMKRGQRGDAAALSIESTGGIIVGTDSPDGRASTYHLTPGLDPSNGMYEYTSRCVGQPPLRGTIAVDRVDASEPIEPIGPYANARVHNNSITKDSIHLLGTVFPGARVSIGAKPVALGPADMTGVDPPIFPTFAIDVPVSPDRRVAAVRVDDLNGAHFYVIRSSGMAVIQSCATTMTAPKQAAAALDAQGDHAGALRTFETAMAACKPDRETLSLALEYACKAGDTEAARKYWRKLPPELQRAVEPACARNEITRDALDRH
ncbi:MAG: hypothetical protein HOV81_12185 [Kofleriaceae bacterium]|nr:hypothetical protein [Kofleriaceae bacterium]